MSNSATAMKKHPSPGPKLGGSPAVSKASPNAKTAAHSGGSKAGTIGTAGKSPAPKPDSHDQLPPKRDYVNGQDLVEPSEEEMERQVQHLLANPDELQPSVELTKDLIIRTHVVEGQPSGGHSVASELFIKQLTHLRLDRLRIAALPGNVLGQLPAVTHLYLQHNRITDMAPLAALPKLQFLALANNRITKVDGISKLSGLMLLDLSHNAIPKLDPKGLPASIRFLKVDGNPCAAGALRAPLRAALLKQLPRLHHMDRDINSDGEEEEDEEEEEQGGGAEGSHQAAAVAQQAQAAAAAAPNSSRTGAAPAGGGAAAASAAGEGESPAPAVAYDGVSSGVMEGVMDLLEDMERKLYGTTMRRAGNLVRSSISRSDQLRASGSRPSSASAASPAPATQPAAAAPPSGAVRSPSPARGPGRTPSPGRGPAAGAGAGSAGGLRTPSATRADGPPLLARANSAHGQGLSGLPSGKLPLPAAAPTSAGSRPTSAGVPTMQLPAPLPPTTPRPANALTEAQQHAQLEAGVEEDLAMLQARLQALLEPASTSTLAQDAAVYDACRLIHTQLDRLKGQAADRISAQRDVDQKVAAAIHSLRTSSAFAQIKNTPPSMLLRRPAGARPGSSGQQPGSRPGTSGSNGGAAGARALLLPQNGEPVQVVAHNVLRDSLQRLEGVLAGAGASAGASSRPPSVGNSSGGGGGAAGGGAQPGSTPGGQQAAPARPGPASGRPASAAGRPSGAALAAAKAAAGPADVEAEMLAVPDGDDVGGEKMENEEPSLSPEASADFGFMFKTTLPPNPFAKR